MARRFTRASSEHVDFNDVGQPFRNFGWGTVATVVRFASDGSGGNYHALLGNNAPGNADDGSLFLRSDLNHPSLFFTSAGTSRDCATQTVTASLGWVLMAATKGTGIVIPRSHLFVWSTGTWNHADMSGTMADNTSFDTTLPVMIGSGHFGDYFDGDMAAIMVANNRAMTDSECERLASGGWERWVTRPDDFLAEFPSGRDPAGTATVRTTSRAAMRSTATSVGTSRSAVADPPGFRFSARCRRR